MDSTRVLTGREVSKVLPHFNLYALFVLSFVQLVLSTLIVLSPARHLDSRLRITGSRVTEVLVGTVGTAVVSAVSSFITAELWGFAAAQIETAALLLMLFTVAVMTFRSYMAIAGEIFYTSYLGAGLTSMAFAGLIASAASRSIFEALTATLWILLSLSSAVPVVIKYQLRLRRFVPHAASAPSARGRPDVPAHGLFAHTGL